MIEEPFIVQTAGVPSLFCQRISALPSPSKSPAPIACHAAPGLNPTFEPLSTSAQRKSAGWVGEGYDGVHIFAPDGTRIGQILLPEICSNVCFGGPKRNRLFMTGSQSLYSLYVGTRGAHIS